MGFPMATLSPCAGRPCVSDPVTHSAAGVCGALRNQSRGGSSPGMKTQPSVLQKQARKRELSRARAPARVWRGASAFEK